MLKKTTILHIAIFTLVISCDKSNQEPTGSDVNNSASPVEFNELLQSINAPGWPARPRRTFSLSENITNDTTVGVGLSLDFLGNELSSTLEVLFGFSWTSNLLLIRHSPDGQEGIMKLDENQLEDAPKRYFLNVEDDRDFVGLCTYSAGVQSNLTWSNKLSIFGNGIGNSTAVGRNMESGQSSNFFRIRKTDSLHSLRRKCIDDFRRQVRKSVARDMARTISELVGEGSIDAKPYEIAKAATLFGPKSSAVRLEGNTWYVHQATWDSENEGTKITIKQRLIRHRLHAPGVPYDYTIVIDKGEIVSEYYNRDELPFKKIAIELAGHVFKEESKAYVPEGQEGFVVPTKYPGDNSNGYGQILKGQKFTDIRKLSRAKKITSISLRGTDDRFLGIGYKLDNGQVIAHGMVDDGEGTVKKIDLDQDEYISSVDLSLGDSPYLRVYSVVINTTKDRKFSMGIETMNRHTIAGPCLNEAEKIGCKQIIGFFGRKNDVDTKVDQLGAYYQSMPD